MILRLNASEMADWQENWCWRCRHDHGFSHGPGNYQPPPENPSRGCPLLRMVFRNEDVPQFEAHGEDWYMTIPAGVVCTRFKLCAASECNDHGDEEQRGGETRRQFHDRLRVETIALPFVDASVS